MCLCVKVLLNQLKLKFFISYLGKKKKSTGPQGKETNVVPAKNIHELRSCVTYAGRYVEYP
jgi:hypothetical protein